MTTDIPYQGIFETHLNVSNLERSAAFYEGTLGLTLGFKDENRGVRLYWIGDRGGAMLGLWEKEPSLVVRQHFAFRTTPEWLPAIENKLRESGVTVRNFNDTDEGPLVFGWMPAVSIYFEDPDGHSLEFLAMLPGEPKPELGILPWPVWERLNGGGRHD